MKRLILLILWLFLVGVGCAQDHATKRLYTREIIANGRDSIIVRDTMVFLKLVKISEGIYFSDGTVLNTAGDLTGWNTDSAAAVKSWTTLNFQAIGAYLIPGDTAGTLKRTDTVYIATKAWANGQFALIGHNHTGTYMPSPTGTGQENYVPKWSAAAGGPVWRPDSVGSGGLGDIEGVTAGIGMSGGGTSGTPTLNMDTTLAWILTRTRLDLLLAGYAPLVSPAFTTPNIGAATGGSLALGGATLGTNALAVTGDVYIGSSSANIEVTMKGIGAYSVALNLDRGASYRTGGIVFKESGSMQWFMGQAYNGGSGESGFSIGTTTNKSDSKFYMATATYFLGLGTITPYHQQSIKTTSDDGWVLFRGDINTNESSATQQADTASLKAKWNSSTGKWEFIVRSATGVPDTLAGRSEVPDTTNLHNLAAGALPKADSSAYVTPSDHATALAESLATIADLDTAGAAGKTAITGKTWYDPSDGKVKTGTDRHVGGLGMDSTVAATDTSVWIWINGHRIGPFAYNDPASEQQTVYDTVDAQNRDAYSANTTMVVTDNGELHVGENGAYRQVGVQFPLAIPQGATIDSVFITMETYFIDGVMQSTDTITVKAFNVDNVAVFTTAAGMIQDHAALVADSVHWGRASWPEGVEITTPNLKTLLQAVVNRGSWASGNYAGFVLRQRAYTTGHLMCFKDGTSSTPRIRVVYH